MAGVTLDIESTIVNEIRVARIAFAALLVAGVTLVVLRPSALLVVPLVLFCLAVLLVLARAGLRLQLHGPSALATRLEAYGGAEPVFSDIDRELEGPHDWISMVVAGRDRIVARFTDHWLVCTNHRIEIMRLDAIVEVAVTPSRNGYRERARWLVEVGDRFGTRVRLPISMDREPAERAASRLRARIRSLEPNMLAPDLSASTGRPAPPASPPPPPPAGLPPMPSS